MRNRILCPRGARIAPLALALAAVVALAGAASAAAIDPADAARQAVEQKRSPTRFAGRPSGANPYLSFLPAGATPDYAAWQDWIAAQGKAKAATQAPADVTRLIVGSEAESNDTLATANPVPLFGTGFGDDPSADLSGTMAAPPPPAIIGPFAEDDGSIPLAVPTGLVSGATVRASGTIGDGPYGSGGTGSGDFDFFALGTLAAGDEILIDVDTPIPYCCDLDPFVGIWSAAGTLLAYNDDQPQGGTYDSYLAYRVPAAGAYFVSIGPYSRPFPTNPFDSSSGTGLASQGTYDITLGVNVLDRDDFSFQLDPGDVIAATVPGGTAYRVTLFDPTGVERMGSSQDFGALTPGPFPSGGPTLTYVAETAGTWTVEVARGAGPYTLQLRAFRPPLEQTLTGAAQVLFVDFDGATIDASVFGGPPSATLSPLSSFLAGWGLTPADESPLIDAILAVIEENLSQDMRVLGANGDYDATLNPGDFDIVLLNSRDHADPFGDSRVTRLIVGGTIPELGIGTIGIAQSVDPGNFATEETAVVLLDLLSASPSDPNSLNQFAVSGGLTKLDLVARGVGNVASHEAGHLFAAFHTNQFDAQANVMDQGGNLPNTVGVGPDLTLGTGDDVDVDFGDDAYVPNEGFTGTEDTLNAVAFGLSTGGLDCPVAPAGGCRAALKSSLQLRDKALDKSDALSFDWQRGAETTFSDLGTPLTTSLYRICVYDAGGLVRSVTAPAGGLCKGKPCWKQTGSPSNPNGFKYKDPDLTPDGASTIALRSGGASFAKVQWKAKGVLLDDSPLGLVPPVVVEVSNSDTAVCFGQTFTAADISRNTSVDFKAKAP